MAKSVATLQAGPFKGLLAEEEARNSVQDAFAGAYDQGRYRLEPRCEMRKDGLVGIGEVYEIAPETQDEEPAPPEVEAWHVPPPQFHIETPAPTDDEEQ